LIGKYVYARDVSFQGRQALRVTFDEVAALYHRARPRYPESLFSDIFEVTGLQPPARLLEIGAGTGIATTVLAERGFDVVGVELGDEMAQAARENLARFAAVEIVTGSFETYSSNEAFDAALAFSAFHWIDPNIRYHRAAALLRGAGFLIVADARFGAPDEEDTLFSQVGEDHETVLGESARRPGAPGLTSLRDEMIGSGLFDHVAERAYRWHLQHNATSYIDLLDTMPWYRTLEPSPRTELYERIATRIRAQPDGIIKVAVEAVLDVATKK
jgi:SAM-dependent methyltransferase